MESKVSKKELDKLLDKPVSTEFEIKKGSWREKGNAFSNQTYAVLHSIKEV